MVNWVRTNRTVLLEYADGEMGYKAAMSLLKMDKCYGEYSILGYSRLADSGLLYGWDVYHTDLQEWRLRQGVDASQISIERLPYEDYNNVYDDEF